MLLFLQGQSLFVGIDFMTSLTGAEMSDKCGLWAPRLISATVVYNVFTKCKKNCCYIIMCKAHIKVPQAIKQQKYFHHFKGREYSKDCIIISMPFR